MKRNLLMVAVLMLAVLALSAMGADDALVGTWKLNAAESTFPSGQTQKSATRKQQSQSDASTQIIWDGV
jgi:hypothetical protein